MANYRTLLKTSVGTNALLITLNSLKSKPQEEAYTAKNLKRHRRAKVKHFPSLPSGDTPESLEQESSLLAELQKRNNRQEARALKMKAINAEFMRITTVPLETKFLVQLDKHSTKLLEVIRSKGGVVKEKTIRTLQVLDETVDITIRRECILKSLKNYLGEPVQHLIKEYQDMPENDAEELE
ncbi:hypothetical protein N1851_013018 [Merluccius polli]|uniref:Uncharacterized protein n=1 Tax=Merluccius polli TaxID=89951 RepID=A0AA47MWM7_MERPO|nr:hypothetical protein N1851_013018 [Merluccius polli]